MILVFAMCFLQHVTAYRLDHPDICIEDQEYCEAVSQHFSSVQATMVALFQASTGGREWSEIYNIVGRSGLVPQTQFIAFVIIITSLFVDRAMTLAQPDHEEKILRRKEEDHQIHMDLKELFKHIDTDDDGYVTAADVDVIKHDSHVID